MLRPTARRLMALFTASVCVLTASAAFGQTTSPAPPPKLDDQLRTVLGLGDAQGCWTLLRTARDGDALQAALLALGSKIGTELAAICLPNAVASASSLGGGFQSLQATKTSTQFRLPRSRIDARARAKARPPAPKPGREFAYSWIDAHGQSDDDTAPRTGGGVFGTVQFGTRDRAGTPYESPYTSNVTDFLVGADVSHGSFLAGGWIGQSTQNADFTSFSALTPNVAGQQATVLSDPVKLSSICGGLNNGGGFDQNARQFGGFAAWGVGGPVFVDAEYGWTHRDHTYGRSLCGLEFQGTLVYNNGVLTDDVHKAGSNPDRVTAIYAGVISGTTAIEERGFSVRAGVDAGHGYVTGGPRAILTMTQATTSAYSETGRSTVANAVISRINSSSGGQVSIPRTLGGPTGFELAYDEQTRNSTLLELGGEVAVHLGPVSPFFAGYLRREFNTDYPIATARFVEDKRTDAYVLTFGYDAYDPNSIHYAFGATIVGGSHVAIRAEFSRLMSDFLFSGHVFSAQAHIRF